eukprot:bmy_21991T0
MSISKIRIPIKPESEQKLKDSQKWSTLKGERRCAERFSSSQRQRTNNGKAGITQTEGITQTTVPFSELAQLGEGEKSDLQNLDKTCKRQNLKTRKQEAGEAGGRGLRRRPQELRIRVTWTKARPPGATSSPSLGAQLGSIPRPPPRLTRHPAHRTYPSNSNSPPHTPATVSKMSFSCCKLKQRAKQGTAPELNPISRQQLQAHQLSQLQALALPLTPLPGRLQPPLLPAASAGIGLLSLSVLGSSAPASSRSLCWAPRPTSPRKTRTGMMVTPTRRMMTRSWISGWLGCGGWSTKGSQTQRERKVQLKTRYSSGLAKLW